MKQEVKIDQADYTVFILVRDTTGNAKTALVFGDIDLAYARVETDNDVTTTDVAPATLGSLTAAHDDWGFLLVSDTDHPGLYRLDIADEVFATGAWSAVVTLTGTGLEPSHLEFVMVPEQPYSKVVPPTVAQFEARTIVSADYVVVGDTIARVTLVDTTTTNSDMRGTDGVSLVIPPSVAQFNARTIPSADYVLVTDTIARVTLVDTTTTNSDMRGTDGVSLVIPPSVAQLNARTLVAANYTVAGTAMALTAAAVDDIWDEIVEAGATARQSLTISNAFHAGITTGGGTATINFRDLADTQNRIRMTGVNAAGNRGAVALSL